MKISLHWCLLDSECRKYCPAMLYIHLETKKWKRTVRFNPPYDHSIPDKARRELEERTGKKFPKWDLNPKHAVQYWKSPQEKS